MSPTLQEHKNRSSRAYVLQKSLLLVTKLRNRNYAACNTVMTPPLSKTRDDKDAKWRRCGRGLIIATTQYQDPPDIKSKNANLITNPP